MGHVFAALQRRVPVLLVLVAVEAWAEPREPEELRAVLALVSDAGGVRGPPRDDGGWGCPVGRLALRVG